MYNILRNFENAQIQFQNNPATVTGYKTLKNWFDSFCGVRGRLVISSAKTTDSMYELY